MTGSTAPSSRVTTTALRAGSLVSGGLFVIGMLLAIAHPDAGGRGLQPDRVLSGLVTLDPRAFLSAAAGVLIVTPAVGLLASALELSTSDRGAAVLALSLVAILAISVVIAAST